MAFDPVVEKRPFGAGGLHRLVYRSGHVEIIIDVAGNINDPQTPVIGVITHATDN